MIDSMWLTFDRLIEYLTITSHRYLYHDFNLDHRLTGIIGPRGVGKTTLMLQYIKEKLYQHKQVFYFSADHIYLSQTNLFTLVEYLYSHHNIHYYFIDEIHKYANWNQELKNIYDSFPMIKVVFSGSSSIDLIKGSYDLSRRAHLFYLNGLSFREYLNFVTDNQFEKVSWESLIHEPQRLCRELGQFPKLLGLFDQYCQQGYYPFILEKTGSYYDKVSRIVDKTILEDIAQFYSIKTTNLVYFKKILSYLTTIPPGNLNTHNVSQKLQIDHKTAFHYLTMLNDTGMIRLLYPQASGNQLLTKPEKIFLHNSTLLWALNQLMSENVVKGMQRECFFIQSVMDAGITVHYSKQGDFIVNNMVFEIGGRNKTSRQIMSSKQPAFLVKDDVIYASGQQIPLWCFGFLY